MLLEKLTLWLVMLTLRFAEQHALTEMAYVLTRMLRRYDRISSSTRETNFGNGIRTILVPKHSVCLQFRRSVEWKHCQKPSLSRWINNSDFFYALVSPFSKFSQRKITCLGWPYERSLFSTSLPRPSNPREGPHCSWISADGNHVISYRPVPLPGNWVLMLGYYGRKIPR